MDGILLVHEIVISLTSTLVCLGVLASAAATEHLARPKTQKESLLTTHPQSYLSLTSSASLLNSHKTSYRT